MTELSRRGFSVGAAMASLGAATGAKALDTRHIEPRITPAVESRFKIYEGRYEAPRNPFFVRHEKLRRLTDYPGRPVIVTFWATWCQPCAREMPMLDRMAEDLPQVAFAPLAQDRKISIRDIERYYRLHRITALEPAIDSGRSLAKLMGVPGTPTSLILDGTAGIRAAAVGNVDWRHPDVYDFLLSLA